MKMYDYERRHIDLLRSHLAECTVLLKSNGDFPLQSAGKIAAYGNGVRKTVKGGTGSGDVNSRYVVNVEQGLENAGFTITSKSWLDAYDEQVVQARKQFVKDIKARAKVKHTNAVLEGMGAVMSEPEYDLPQSAEGDVAVYVLSRISGEGNDRTPEQGDIKLTNTEIRDILSLNRKYPKFMLVLNVGGVVDLSSVAEVENILILSQLGIETGDALADILLGKTNPSGKLATTWSAWEDYCAVGDFGEPENTRYKEGIYVGYRYFDSVGKKALFPFGYGLSYTDFSFVTDSVTVQSGTVCVKETVTNIGKRPGKEVIQVYISSPEGKLDQPYQALTGFAKTAELAAGASEQLQITFDLANLASFDTERSAYVLEPGNYVVRTGNSSTNTKVAALIVLDNEVIVTQVRSCCGTPDFQDWKPQKRVDTEIPTNVPVIAVASSDFRTKAVVYDQPQEMDAFIKDLTNEQLAYTAVGAFKAKASAFDIIGNASNTIAGAAGESTSKLNNLGFPTMIMADGPAGLRLTPMSYQDEKGVHSIGTNGFVDGIKDFMPALPRLVISLTSKRGAKPKKGCEVIYRYATAIPIGTALAQSWNVELAQLCGDIVGEEANRFGVNLWLAPALNIHRSIRCGRNFEYFSEDPLISGKFAAAITRGVQKHPGCGVTIKHYAVNNQEYNRYCNNSVVSERAMREIYLKGFEICVKEAQPCAVMTSYNLLNGQHTSESRGLIEDILRSEYGFEGIVMTDWIIADMNKIESSHPAPMAHKIAAGGGDLVMPGSKGDYDDILQGVIDGSLTKEQLQINATRVYRMAKKLTHSQS